MISVYLLLDFVWNNTIKEGASWTYDTPSVIDKIFSKTNHMQISFCFLAAYMQLVTPSEVAIAVRMLIAIWITIFQVSFFIVF